MKHILLILFLLSCLFLFSQSEVKNDSIQKMNVHQFDEQPFKDFFVTYFQTIQKMDLDAMLDYVHPGLYNIIPKDLMKKQFEELFHNDLLETKFDKMQYQKLNSAFRFENVNYYIVDYQSVFTIAVLKKEDKSEEDFMDYLDLFEGMFKGQFSNDVVIRDKNAFTIDGLKKMIIIEDPSFDGYKLLEIKPEMKYFYKKFLPESVVAYLLP